MTHHLEHPDRGIGKTVTCPICKKNFTCHLSPTCWCATRVVPTEVRSYLADRYTSCVCSTCLDQLIEKSGTGESP